MKKRIEEMFAFVSIDPKDDIEGVVAANLRGNWHPLVGADMERIESLRPLAAKVARDAGIKIRLIKFSVREDLGEVEP